MKYVVNLVDGSEHAVEAAWYKRDEASGRIVFVSDDGLEVRSFPFGDVRPPVKRLPAPRPSSRESLDEQWMMEEYRALRAEILANEDYQKSLLVFGTPAILVAMGWILQHSAIEADRHWFLLVLQCFALGLWFTSQGLGYHTDRIGVYIYNRFERFFPLSWERFQRVSGAADARKFTLLGSWSLMRETIGLPPIKNPDVLRRFLETVHFLMVSLLCTVLILLDRPAVNSQPPQPLWRPAPFFAGDGKVLCQAASLLILLYMILGTRRGVIRQGDIEGMKRESQHYLSACEDELAGGRPSMGPSYTARPPA
ncbi:MAG: hypothetical protein U0835_21645 [Isosphaeraceae bacterium]